MMHFQDKMIRTFFLLKEQFGRKMLMNKFTFKGFFKYFRK